MRFMRWVGNIGGICSGGTPRGGRNGRTLRDRFALALVDTAHVRHSTTLEVKMDLIAEGVRQKLIQLEDDGKYILYIQESFL